jgi:hypothetical protein
VTARTSWKDRPLGARGVALGLGLIAVLASAAACTAEALRDAPPTGAVMPSPADSFNRKAVNIIDVQVRGRTITCIYLDTGASDEALSCDWEAKS